MNFPSTSLPFSSSLMVPTIPPPTMDTGNTLQEALLSHVSSLEKKIAYYEKSDHTNRISTLVHDILRDAHKNANHAAKRILDLLRLVNPPHPLILRIVKLCLKGAVGRVGERRSLRAVAILLLDHVIEKDKNVQALCLRGEILTPAEQGGYNDPFTPRAVLEEAFTMFEQASTSGDATALFLKGRWLVLNEPLHHKKSHVEEGKRLILQAIDRGCARAINFLAEALDKTDYESKDVHEDSGVFFQRLPPNGRGTSKQARIHRERYILSLYVQAAKLGDPNALNDLGACFSGGYAGLEKNFELTTAFYKASIKQGENIAYDNLGVLYELGMNNDCPSLIDRVKALNYYREGARQRSAKCAYYLGLSYEEGVQNVLVKDVDRAKRYFVHAIKLADDAHDAMTAAQAIKNLSSLYFTQIKLTTNPKSKETADLFHELENNIGNAALISRSIDNLNQAILSAIRSKSSRFPQLNQILGESNANAVVSYAKKVERTVRTAPTEENLALYEFIVGVPHFGKNVMSSKVKRTNITRPATSSRSVVRKRRKVSS